jgi:hypothetical protein
MVGIVVNYNLIGIPEPVGAIVVVWRCNAEEKAIEPEAFATASRKVEHMALADAAGKASMFKRVIEVIARVVFTGIVSDPLIICVNVGSFGVSLFVRKLLRRALRLSRLLGLLGPLGLLLGPRRRSFCRGRPAGRNVTVANILGAAARSLGAAAGSAAPSVSLFGDSGEQERYQYREKSDCSFHTPDNTVKPDTSASSHVMVITSKATGEPGQAPV